MDMSKKLELLTCGDLTIYHGYTPAIVISLMCLVSYFKKQQVEGCPNIPLESLLLCNIFFVLTLQIPFYFLFSQILNGKFTRRDVVFLCFYSSILPL